MVPLLLFQVALIGFFVSFSILTTASPLVKRIPAVGACSGACQGDVHDPSVVYRADTKTYYRFVTNNLIRIATAPSLSGPWTNQGAALPNGSSIQLPGRDDLWAPDVFNVQGTYYLYYAVSKIGSETSDIGVATSKTMDSRSWTDHGSIGIPANTAYNRIDPNLFQHSADSTPYLSFGSFWQNIFQVPMANPPLTVAGGTTHLAQNTSSPAYMEGSYQFQWDEYYYLFFSSGECCNVPPNLPAPGDEYKILVCRSSSPNGGFVDQAGRDCLTQNGGTLVLGSHDDVYAPGGQGVMFDPQQNSPVVYYHYVNPSVSYDYSQFFFGWNKLDFSSGWPVVV
ncbi:arabinan endo-1,5-alpha-L-arabinosidase A [Lecanosticta acicola]|uniref:Arabinan endo-1,5-alpha-L-arabinosidase n=1 Tax=Lecanosticta acicola TaxID=111012 RepID=A0AAI8Z135_9PEZI|nr:arabinan endo-1,5-alpha-L-arabinosidase A [Lecanosticta acicola]